MQSQHNAWAFLNANAVLTTVVIRFAGLPTPKLRACEGEEQVLELLWSSWSIRDLIATTPAEQQAAFTKQVDVLKQVDAEMSDIYQHDPTPRRRGLQTRVFASTRIN